MAGPKVTSCEMVMAGASWHSCHARAVPPVGSVLTVTLFIGLFIIATVVKGVGSPQLYYHDYSGTASQVRPQGRHR